MEELLSPRVNVLLVRIWVAPPASPPPCTPPPCRTVTASTPRPKPPKVAVLETITSVPAAKAPESSSSPPSTITPPVKLLVLLINRLPAPTLVRP